MFDDWYTSMYNDFVERVKAHKSTPISKPIEPTNSTNSANLVYPTNPRHPIIPNETTLQKSINRTVGQER